MQPNNAGTISSGKVVGGTSTINSMMWVRGNEWNYDNWQNLGNPGWSWNDVSPYFITAEDVRIPETTCIFVQMVWTLGNNSAICTPFNPSQSPCTSSMISLLTLLSTQLSGSWDSPRSTDNEEISEVDFIVVGAGTAGCVVANRLSEIPNWKVLLMERGDEEPIVAEAPSFSHVLKKSSVDYAYTSQPQSNVCGTQPNHECAVPRGKAMGGSSSINGMMWTRGNKWDYDNWQKLGNPGWSWKDVLPYFIKAEDLRIPEVLEKYPSFHGTGGYQTLEYEPYDKNVKVIFEAWKELGLKEIDYNSGENIGISRVQHANKNGSRQSSNGAYIRPIRRKRKNLYVRPNSWVTKIIINPKTKRAIGIEYRSEKSSVTKKVFARKEVILSAGVVDSPKLLMLSGVGPVDNLKESGIEVIHSLPSVGKNLHNHFFVPTSLRVEINHKRKPFNLIKTLHEDIEAWMKGVRNSSVSKYVDMDSVVFLKTSMDNVPQTSVPDVRVMMSKYKRNGTKLVGGLWPYYDGYNLAAQIVNPKSRGMLKLDSKDPLNNQPLIYPNYFSDPRDIAIMPEACKLINRIAMTQTLKKAGYTISKEIPADCADVEFESLSYFHCLMKNNIGFSAHFIGTCKMGPKSDPTAVVDSRLRVHGIKGLRVIDGSIMPVITRGGVYAPIVMIGERASVFIKEDWDKLASC